MVASAIVVEVQMSAVAVVAIVGAADMVLAAAVGVASLVGVVFAIAAVEAVLVSTYGGGACHGWYECGDCASCGVGCV